MLFGMTIKRGPHQLCLGQIAGTEAAVHAVRSVFNHNDNDTILLVDATIAFNSTTIPTFSLCSY